MQLTPTATKLLYSSGRPRPPFQVSSSCTRPIKLEILLHEIDTSPFCTKCPLISVIVALTLDRHVVVAPVIRLTRAQCTPYPYAILRGFSTPLATAALCGQSRARYCVHGPFKMRATVRGIGEAGEPEGPNRQSTLKFALILLARWLESAKRQGNGDDTRMLLGLCLASGRST